MELIRQQEFLNQYHYDARNPEWEKEHGTPKNNVEVTFQLVSKDEEQNSTTMVTVLQFLIVFEKFVISGGISQMVTVSNRIINEPKEFKPEEVRELSAPLLDMLNRLTYDVTEIAFDEQGINLEF